MIALQTLFTNLSWALSAYPAWRQFHRHSFDPRSRQLERLAEILRANKDTEYGRKFGFDGISNAQNFRERVPLSEYEDIHDAVLRSAGGESGLLTTEPITLLEPSGGSSGGAKFIPYTKSLASEFNRGVQSWIFDMFSHQPALAGGKAYWSISPANAVPQIPGSKIPVGFQDDSEYLSPLGRIMMKQVLAVPPSVSKISDMAAFRYTTLLFLLKTPDLRLISVWNPTFLSLLLDDLEPNWDHLLEDISSGQITSHHPIPEALCAELEGKLQADPKRAAELRSLGSSDLHRIWPDLGLISCWRDGFAARYADLLQEKYFPGIQIQGKGLLATEAFISFPLHGKEGAVLAVDSHFFEFQPLDSEEQAEGSMTLLADELELGQQYSVIVTTGGGLYRYRLHDIIEVTDLYNQLPCFRFKGKTDHYSDLFGEKLSETFVGECVADVLNELENEPAFLLLAPEQTAEASHYSLYVEGPLPQVRQHLEIEMEVRLRRNYHYDYCRNLGQLGPLAIRYIGPGSAAKYLEERHRSGQKLGDIKASILDGHSGWDRVFEVLS